ncbi:hypothetical protein EnPhBC-611_gp72 [Enterococcus phage BC611]|uniref:Uncharacterized protein n=1 Tax=Enterococcus phage BC611 TaxID=1173135 RepID=K0IX54_9CAUD|nr:hypothetical protein EnPhBC-611_gp72 [Enterococcus phage BC611]BAM44935.1 unnamed protein product [Enterococcus phage BC611]
MDMKTKLKLAGLWILLGVMILLVLVDWLLPLAMLKWLL